VGIIRRDLFSLYDTLCANPAHDCDLLLGRLERQYLDWANHQWQLLESPYGEAVKQFWTRTLDGAVEVILPGAPPSFAHSGPIITCGENVRETSIADLDRLVQQEQITRPIVLLTALFALLHRVSGQTDLCVAMPINARSDEFSEVVGFFTIPVILRVQIDHDLTLGELCKRVRDAFLAAYEWRSVPCYAVYPLPRGLWKIAFNYQRIAPTPPAGELDIHPTQDSSPKERYLDLDFQWNVREAADAGQLQVELFARNDVYGEDALRAVLAGYIAVLQQLLACPDELVRSS
jgi:hypothetical protein